MKCMLCGEELDEHGLCFGCLNRTQSESAPVAPPPKKRKARIWPGIVCLILIFSIGLGVFLWLRPVSDPDMPWFTLVNGMLSFNESLYEGPEILDIPASIAGHPVTAIAPRGFTGTKKITYMELPDTIEYIGDRAFADCTLLRGIKLPEGLKAMGSEVFDGCKKLEAVTIPLSMTTIGRKCFNSCSSLQFLFYPGSIKQFQTIGLDKIPETTQIRCNDGVYQQEAG